MDIVKTFMRTVLDGGVLNKKELLQLASAETDDLCGGADMLRQKFCGNRFDLCSIINGKSGDCSEDCKFCSQSSHYPAAENTERYPLIDAAAAKKAADNDYQKGVLRFSIVTAGRTLSDVEIEKLCDIYRGIKIAGGGVLCASHGLLSYGQLLRLKAAGVTRIHNNLETSRRYFSAVCSTHTYDDKIETIQNAQKAGFSVCCGGIIGLGETVGDRIDLALELRGLGVKSVPLNILNPIPGTPLAAHPVLTEDEVRKTAALFRFILPDAAIRLAGGRGLLPDRGKSVFLSGANAAITGDMLTTAGTGIADDIQMIRHIGYEVSLL